LAVYLVFPVAPPMGVGGNGNRRICLSLGYRLGPPVPRSASHPAHGRRYARPSKWSSSWLSSGSHFPSEVSAVSVTMRANATVVIRGRAGA